MKIWLAVACLVAASVLGGIGLFTGQLIPPAFPVNIASASGLWGAAKSLAPLLGTLLAMAATLFALSAALEAPPVATTAPLLPMPAPDLRFEAALADLRTLLQEQRQQMATAQGAQITTLHAALAEMEARLQATTASLSPDHGTQAAQAMLTRIEDALADLLAPPLAGLATRLEEFTQAADTARQNSAGLERVSRDLSMASASVIARLSESAAKLPEATRSLADAGIEATARINAAASQLAQRAETQHSATHYFEAQAKRAATIIEEAGLALSRIAALLPEAGATLREATQQATGNLAAATEQLAIGTRELGSASDYVAEAASLASGEMAAAVHHLRQLLDEAAAKIAHTIAQAAASPSASTEPSAFAARLQQADALLDHLKSATLSLQQHAASLPNVLHDAVLQAGEANNALAALPGLLAAQGRSAALVAEAIQKLQTPPKDDSHLAA